LQWKEVLEWFGGRDKYKLFHEEDAGEFTNIAQLIEEGDQ
jgi:putative transposase